GGKVHLGALASIQPVHLQPGVLLPDDFDRRRKELVAADVVAVRVRVDDGRYWLCGDGFDCVEYRLAPAGELRVDQNDAEIRDEDRRVSTSAREYVEVVPQLLDLDDLGSRRLGLVLRF